MGESGSRSAANELSINSIALALKMDRQTVGKRLDEIKAIPSGVKQKARYGLRDVIRALAADVGASSDEISYADQLSISRTRKTEVETQAAELKLKILAKTMNHSSVFADALGKVFVLVDHFLLTAVDQLEIDQGLTGSQIEQLNEGFRSLRRALVASVNSEFAETAESENA